MEESLERILSPKRPIDVMQGIRKAQEEKR